MASIITNAFRILQAKQFRQAFNPTASSSMYLGISKPSQWANELIPDNPIDSSSFNVADIREWMAAKRLTTTDTTLAIPRYNWTTGTIYEAYDDADTEMFNKQFFVMTDEFKVYKCIRKPTPTTQSTSKPTATPTSGYVTTGDGYVWKYMFSLDAASAARFLTSLWIPVKELAADDSSGSNQWQVQQGATPGTIDRIVVENGGSGYVTPTITITGDGTGAAATATVVGGVITGITMTNIGSGYTWAKITITGTGSGAVIRPILSPVNGHGSSAVSELGAFYVVVNGLLNYDESGKFPKFNDYRKIFLIQNPCLYGTSTVASDPVYSTVRKLTVAATDGNFVADEVIVGQTSGAKGVVVEYNSDAKTVSIVATEKSFQSGENIVGQTSGTNGTNIVSNVNPELDPNRGSIVYKDYRRYVDRQEGQSENVIIAIEF